MQEVPNYRHVSKPANRLVYIDIYLFFIYCILITWQSSAEETPVCIWTGLPGGREQLRGTNLLQVSYADPAQSSRAGGAPPDTVPQLERKSPLTASFIRLHSLNS